MPDKQRYPPLLNLPGYAGSGEGHWQTLWEDAIPDLVRVEQRDWEEPDVDEWKANLAAAVRACAAPPVIVAHSLGCALVAHFALDESLSAEAQHVRAALLVAPADCDEIAGFYSELESFVPVPLARLPFPTTLVVGDNDMYATAERARLLAESWGSKLVVLKGAGHINPDAGFGPWPEGEQLLSELIHRTS